MLPAVLALLLLTARQTLLSMGYIHVKENTIFKLLIDSEFKVFIILTIGLLSLTGILMWASVRWHRGKERETHHSGDFYV